MNEKDDRDSWGELNQQSPKPKPADPKRERSNTIPFAIERPSTKILAIGNAKAAEATPSRVSRTFKRPVEAPAATKERSKIETVPPSRFRQLVETLKRWFARLFGW